jgi:hypothetical protein
MSTAPVRRQVTVEVPQQRAFEFFTARMASWWNPDHQIGGKPFEALVIEPHVGGRWFERDAEGAEEQWGSVLAWEPHDRVLLAWQLDGTWRYDPDFVTELEIRFVPEGEAATRVELEHRGLERFGDAADDIRAQLDGAGGWQGLLGRFAREVGV